MIKRVIVAALMLALLLPGAAVAEVTNRDMQLYGGVVVSNSSDSFFFAPMEEGMTKHWGLYALSKVGSGPIITIEDGYPARLVHADESKVYFLGYTDGERSVHALYSVEIATGTPQELLTGIASAFVGETSEDFLYVSTADPYTLCRYTIPDGKDEKVKDMSASKKAIYDAGIYDSRVFFITRAENGTTEDGYEYHYSSGKATNLDKPSPQLVNGLLYEGYRIYAGDSTGQQIYAVRLGEKTGKRLGQNFPMSLTNPRFGQYVYSYDGENNRIIAVPLDGSAEKTLALDGGAMKRFVIGGSKDELFIIHDNAIYSLTPDLSSQNKLFDFDSRTGGQVWSYIVPAGNNAILVMGYSGETFTNSANLMPTGVYAYDRTGQLLFGYPEWDPDSEEETAGQTMPTQFGDVPQDEREEGETYFVFSSGGGNSDDDEAAEPTAAPEATATNAAGSSILDIGQGDGEGDAEEGEAVG